MKSIAILITLFFLVGCTPKDAKPTYPKGINKSETNTTQVPAVKKKNVSVPRKPVKLKEVQTTNYSSSYMYPEDKHQPVKTPNIPKTEKETVLMSKEECLAMIGQEKFDKYTQMFSSETATLKRCTMMKAMQE